MVLKIIYIFKKKFNKLEESLNFKKSRNNINIIHYEDRNSGKELNVKDVDDNKYRKIGSVRRLFEESNRDYQKPKIIDIGFAGEVNNYIKCISEGDKDEKLSPREFLIMIRQDLRDLSNKHKPIEILNNNNIIIMIIIMIIIILTITIIILIIMVIIIILIMIMIMILIVGNGKFC